jgi:hypothetical protein
MFPIELVDLCGEFGCTKYVLKFGVTWDMLDESFLCENPHPAAVEWMLAHPQRIDLKHAGRNTDETITQMICEKYPLNVWEGNPTAAQFILDHMPFRRFTWELSINPSPLTIEYLLKNRNLIYWKYFIVHNDPRIAEIVMNDWDKMDLMDLVFSHDDRVVKRVLEKCDRVERSAQWYDDNLCALNFLCENNHPLVVDWLVAHHELVTNHGFYNLDKRITDIAFKNKCTCPWYIGWRCNDSMLEWICHDKTLALGCASANPRLFEVDKEERDFLLSAM